MLEGVPEAISEDSLVFRGEDAIGFGGLVLVLLREGCGVGGWSLKV